MGRCVFCRKRTHLDMVCKWCHTYLCVSCIQTEVHHCTGMNKLKETQAEMLKHKLHDEKVIGSKLHMI